MRLVIQRVKEARVKIDGEPLSEIGAGLLVLVAAKKGDTEQKAVALAEKVVKLRIMADKEQKMNLSVKDVGGAILAVSQFTLYGDTSGGNRPSFIQAALATEAEKLYDLFVATLKARGIEVETGKFGAYMEVALVNDGPVTLILDTQDK